jgi:hypothetical protein
MWKAHAKGEALSVALMAIKYCCLTPVSDLHTFCMAAFFLTLTHLITCLHMSGVAKENQFYYSLLL